MRRDDRGLEGKVLTRVVTGMQCQPASLGSVKAIAGRSVAFSPLPRHTVRARQLVVRPKATATLNKPKLDVDEDKEERLKQFRVVYDFDKWASHRSTRRYIRHVAGLFNSRIVSGLQFPLTFIGTTATLLCIYQTLLAEGRLPEWAPALTINNPIAFNLSSAALSLLLVFRTNASYGRFDEARKLWGGVVNRSRDVTRMACTYFSAQERELLEAFVRWQATFPWALKNHLREEKPWESDLKDLLKPEEAKALAASPHAPSTVCMTLAEICNRTNMTPAERFRIDENLTYFMDMAGACERILRTPIPVSYTRHTSRFLTIWLFFLPFAIYPKCGWATIPASILLAFVLLAIEEIGVAIEEPFLVLPLEAIATTISTNVKQHLAQVDDISNMVNETSFSNEAYNRRVEDLFEARK